MNKVETPQSLVGAVPGYTVTIIPGTGCTGFQQASFSAWLAEVLPPGVIITRLAQAKT